jgi:lysophospholipase L1-like esterase
LRRLAFLGLAAAAAGCGRRRFRERSFVTRGTGPPVELAVLGDSLALGTGASDSSRGFAFDLYRPLDITRPGSEISNYAIGGSTAADVLRLQVGRLRERRADCVIVCVGGNDVARGIDPQDFAQTYAALVRAIRQTVPGASIVLLGVPDVSISPLFADRAGLVRALALADDRAVRAAARAPRVWYVDLFAITRGLRAATDFLSADRFHPSDSGHALIAIAARPALDQAIASRFARSGSAR